jgi:Tol biopolymer transport system component
MKRHGYIWIGVLILLASGLAGLRSVPDAAQAQEGERCFPETGFCISGQIRAFWEQNGGLPVFGFPITAQRAEEIEGQTRQAQWFQRNRLELNPATGEVLLGRLGVEVLERQGRDWRDFPTNPDPDAGCERFDTGHSVCGEILAAFRSDGLALDNDPTITQDESIGLFGLPISGEIEETLADGETYVVQYFERARFERHPENDPPFNVLLGLLGTELQSSGDADTESRLLFTQLIPNAEGGFNQDIYSCTVVEENTVPVGCDAIRSLTNIPQNDGQAVWSPDGQQIAFESDIGGNWNLYLISGSGNTQLTDNGGTDGAPSWGNIPGLGWRIVFHSNRAGGDFDLYILNPEPDSSQASLETRYQVRGLTANDGINERFPAISPDGSKIAYVANPDGGDLQLYVADLVVHNGNVVVFQERPITTGLAGQSGKPVWSPDSSKLLFENNSTGNNDVYVVDADGNNLQNLTNNPADDGHPTWSPDGLLVAFQSNREEVFAIYIMDTQGQNVVPFIQSETGINIVHPSWQPATTP